MQEKEPDELEQDFVSFAPKKQDNDCPGHVRTLLSAKFSVTDNCDKSSANWRHSTPGKDVLSNDSDESSSNQSNKVAYVFSPQIITGPRRNNLRLARHIVHNLSYHQKAVNNSTCMGALGMAFTWNGLSIVYSDVSVLWCFLIIGLRLYETLAANSFMAFSADC